MYTYALERGDLVLDRSSFRQVTGGAKVTQDLGIATLEPFGCDRSHPGWGSVLNRMVGAPYSDAAGAAVYSEVSRLVANYVATQAAVANLYRTRGQSNPYSASDTVTGLASWSPVLSGTSLTGTLAVSTAAGSVAVPVAVAQ